ncbi:hypothetical protein [Actinomadura algeriensis]|uniref:Uncharacterized protein n=1 Tax=Actinomadura algeriensis TaxID=1679523 RepID=A0ABR9K2F2_9ACTN|nr:hypothetical protein [Actinomadura algeriensis]MBE1536778.1 hypothetical protein [Actinomadura algeriensis]
MGRRIGAWAGTVATGVTAVVLAVFWLAEGLEPAGWLAGVASAFLALSLAAMTLLDRARDRLPHEEERQVEHPESEPPREETDGTARADTTNTVTGGTFSGQVMMIRDYKVGSEHAAEPGSGIAPGTVSNTFSGGEAHGGVLMGRDVMGEIDTGSVAPSPPSAPGPQERPEA